MDYDTLLIEADKENLIVKEKPLKANDGRIKGNRIAIRKDIPTLAEKACVLAEEIGHHKTTAGNIIRQETIAEKKQENAARLWAYNRLIGLRGIIDGFSHGCRNRAELAEYLGVTEAFLQSAIDCYKRKYGLYVAVDNYIVYFEPSLAVLMV